MFPLASHKGKAWVISTMVMAITQRDKGFQTGRGQGGRDAYSGDIDKLTEIVDNVADVIFNSL